MLTILFVLLFISGCSGACQWKFEWSCLEPTDANVNTPPIDLNCFLYFSDTLKMFNSDIKDITIYRLATSDGYANCNTSEPTIGFIIVAAEDSNSFTVNGGPLSLSALETVYLISDTFSNGSCVQMSFNIGAADGNCNQGSVCTGDAQCVYTPPTTTPTTTPPTPTTPTTPTTPAPTVLPQGQTGEISGTEIGLIVACVILVLLNIAAGILLIVVCLFVSKLFKMFTPREGDIQMSERIPRPTKFR